MIKTVPFANAFTVVGVGVYVVCRILASVAPDLLFSIGQSWFHTINLSALQATVPLDIGVFFIGGISTAVLVWLTSYTGAYLYNKFSKD